MYKIGRKSQNKPKYSEESSPMEWFLSKCLMLVLIALIQISGLEACLEEERTGLLEFKRFLKSNNGDADRTLGSWVDDKDKSDCCEWDLVKCNPVTGHVIELNLSSVRQRDFSTCSDPHLRWSFNASLFRPFQDLITLDLSANCFDGFVENEGLVGFEKLEVLDLSNNLLTGSIPGFIWNLSSLQILSLSENELDGPLPTEAFCRTYKLQKLDLSSNSIDGMLPSCLRDLKSLRELDFSSNQFTGNLPSSLMSNLTSLEYIDLGYNHFTGLFSFSSFADNRNLEVVALPSNDAKFEVETEYTTWVPQFQLKVLALPHCNLNKLTGDVPKFLSQQPYLVYIDLSNNNLKGNLPTWMLENKTMLEYLSLGNNSFNGQFPLPSYPNKNLSELDISKNHFSGALGENFGEMLPRVGTLNLAENDFEGHIPSSISKLYRLTSLDLSSNNFSGEVTTELTEGCPNLAILKLSNNRFHGPIFSTQFNMPSLTVLRLDNNQLSGTLSDGLLKCKFSLLILDIGSNYFSGEIPLWIDSIFLLKVLIMKNNSFHGEIRHQFPRVTYLDLSHNSLSGSLPPSLLNGSLKHMHLRGNAFTGSLPIPKHILYPGDLLTLDLADNNLSGKIPDSIGQFSELKILSLRGNNIVGGISNSLCQLRTMSILDLSNNNLSGPIPSCFKNITFGKREVADPYAYAQEVFVMSTRPVFHNYEDKVKKDPNSIYLPQAEVEFTTKNRDGIYKGDILNFMSGLDLSSNNLVGEIPYEIGQLTSIHALNLSHNRLTGTIPKDFSELGQLESLDLSNNSLSGEIPSQLTSLNFLAVFSVAHNNLSGRIPGSIGQFGTFDESSYEGNPFLCGSMIKRKCETVEVQPPSEQYEESEKNWYDIDLGVFSASFAASYITILLVFFALLYINPHWRRRWFYFIEECMHSCYYFASDAICKLSALLCK